MKPHMQIPITQNDFLNGLRRARTRVSIYLLGGASLSAVVIKSFDQHALVLSDGGKTLLLCKSSILTIMPEARPHPKPATKSPAKAVRETREPTASSFGQPPKEVAIAIKRRRRVATPVL